ncbi:LysR family transcriptional regulator [Amycolatopsis jiangsuensis]|uniref:DNA-binding transcriptional LysR family regulator n=1 Tax=Amycolatopsis jiangsuensis TaxID=1181879 RepID=A0A840IPE1_9PSEU|nr:LysR family transcriptional regulator [Amycolatopsis jiangsuensis]MBB4683429.1 DNA-binding transcriptional LysR family regulator [Amycolatopsis jiangsuensis]
MTLTQLRALVAAAELGSFTAAGTALGYTQAAISELVRRLEDECGLQLFHRGGRRLALTSAGDQLLPYARQTVNAAENAENTVKAVRGLTGGVASLGLFRNADFYLLAELGEQFAAAYPDVRVRLVGVNAAVVAEAVAAGDLEAGIVVLPVTPAGLTVTPLARDEVLYVSANPAHVTEPVDITTLTGRRMVLYDAHAGWTDPDRLQLAGRAQAAGVRIEPFAEVEQAQAALHLVARGVGDTFLSRAVAERLLRTEGLPLHTTTFDPPLHNTFALVHRQHTQLSPATGELARLAVDLLLRNPMLEHRRPLPMQEPPEA